MFMEIPKLSIRFIDSLNFLQMPLKSFPKTFGMNELKKGYFPHYFNKECNNYVGPLPSKKHHGYNQKKSDERTKFLKWYEERVSENYVFEFKKEILEYCRSDVDILRRSIMKLREDFIQLENIDPLRYITIASVCMTIYRSNYMPKKTIAIVPESVKTDNFSKMSIMWLNYVSNGVNIQHALNGGEKRLTIDNKAYKVDGFCEETNTIYEFYGCFWYGCSKCYKPNVVNSKNQKDMGTLNDQTIKKRETIENAGYNHISIYECQLAKNKDFRKFAKNFIVEPLNPREGFYGGRVNASKLVHNFKNIECGRYEDVLFLYPTFQYYQKYPIDHPTKVFNPEKYEQSRYGLIKCKVVAPKGDPAFRDQRLDDHDQGKTQSQTRSRIAEMGHFLQITIARKTRPFLKKNYRISRDRKMQKWATFCKLRSQEKLYHFSRKTIRFVLIANCRIGPLSSNYDRKKN